MRAMRRGTSLLWLGVSVAIGLGPALGDDSGPPAAALSFGPRQEIQHGTNQVSGPALQLDRHGKLHLAWIEEGKDEDRGLYLLVVPGEAAPPGAPVRVNPATVPVTALHQPPGLALGQDGTVYLSWSAPHPQADGKPSASLLQLSRSADGGRTFAAPVTVNDDATPTNHTFDHLAVGPDGTVHLAWIDAREGKKEPGTFVTHSADHGRSVAKNLKVDDNTCVCCRTAVTTAPDGTVYVAWRKVFDGNVRETVVARSSDGGQTFSAPVIVGHDRWVFPACPHRPASLGVDKHGRLYVVWYTEGADETPAIYLAVSDDGGRTFSPKRRLNASRGTFPDHPQMAVDREGHLVVAWEEQSPVRREVVVSYSLDRGRTFSRPEKLNQGKAQSPAVAINDRGLVGLAWVEQVFPRKHKTVFQFARLASAQGVSDHDR